MNSAFRKLAGALSIVIAVSVTCFVIAINRTSTEFAWISGGESENLGALTTAQLILAVIYIIAGCSLLLTGIPPELQRTANKPGDYP